MIAAQVRSNFLVHPSLALKVCGPFSRISVPGLSQYHTVSTASPLSLLFFFSVTEELSSELIWTIRCQAEVGVSGCYRLTWSQWEAPQFRISQRPFCFAYNILWKDASDGLFPLLFSLFCTEFTMGDEQIKFKSASHTPLPSQRCNLGQISVMLALLLRLLSLSPRSTTFTLFVFFYMFIVGPGAKIL